MLIKQTMLILIAIMMIGSVNDVISAFALLSDDSLEQLDKLHDSMYDAFMTHNEEFGFVEPELTDTQWK